VTVNHDSQDREALAKPDAASEARGSAWSRLPVSDRLRRLQLWIWLLAATGVVLYLLLRPSPNATGLPLTLGWLVRWLNTHHNLRTLPMAWGYAIVPALLLKPGRKKTLCLGAMLGVLLIAETAQLFLPLRSFTWADVGFSIAGVALAAGMSVGLRKVWMWRLRRQRRGEEFL
jgi:hypothetical protein